MDYRVVIVRQEQFGGNLERERKMDSAIRNVGNPREENPQFRRHHTIYIREGGHPRDESTPGVEKKKRRDTRHRAQLEDAPFPPPAIEHANAIIYYLVNRSLSSLRSCCNYFLLYEGMMGVLFHLSVCLCVYMCVCV